MDGMKKKSRNVRLHKFPRNHTFKYVSPKFIMQHIYIAKPLEGSA